MRSIQRPLAGLRVGISISETADMAARGFSTAGMGRLTVSFTQALLGQGARLAFGHDWRQRGIMDSLCAYAVAELPSSGKVDEPALLNVLPWPGKTTLSAELLARLEGVLEVREAGLPQDLRLRAEHGTGPEAQAYLVSRGLTHLRHELTQVCGARIAIGGKTAGFHGRYPGVLEESLFALATDQPLYLVGLLGGATEAVGRAILDREDMPEGFGDSPEKPIATGDPSSASAESVRAKGPARIARTRGRSTVGTGSETTTDQAELTGQQCSPRGSTPGSSG